MQLGEGAPRQPVPRCRGSSFGGLLMTTTSPAGRFVASLPSVDPDEVFVAGHSVGVSLTAKRGFIDPASPRRGRYQQRQHCRRYWPVTPLKALLADLPRPASWAKSPLLRVSKLARSAITLRCPPTGEKDETRPVSHAKCSPARHRPRRSVCALGRSLLGIMPPDPELLPLPKEQ